MADAEIVTTIVTGDTSGFVRSMDAANKSAVEMKRQLATLMAQFNDFEKAMNVMKGAGLKIGVKVDTGAIDKAESEIRSLEGTSIDVEVTVDTEKAETAIQAIDNNLPTPQIEVTADAEKAENEIQSVDDNLPTPTIQVDGDTSNVEKKLEDLKKLAVIQIVLQMTDNLGELPLVGDLLNIDEQAARVEGKLNTTIPNIQDLLTNISGTGLTNVTGAADAIIDVKTLAQTYGDLETVVTETLGGAKVRGIEFNQQLDEARRLVDAGLAPSITEANNALVFMFQTGADANRDIGGTIEEFSRTFDNAGFSLEQFAVMSGEATRVGARNVEMMGETFLSLRETVDEALSTGEGDAFQVLVDLQLTDEATQFTNGEINGAQFAEGYQKAISDKLAGGLITQAEANNMTTTLLGSYAVDQGFLDIDWTKVTGATIPDNIINESVTKMDNAFLPAVARAGAAIQEQILDRFGGAEGLLDSLTEKLNILTTELQAGTALPEAIEIALAAPGLADTINQFTSTANNLILEFLSGVANILEGLGQGEAAAGVRGFVSDAAAGQLTFDLKLADDAQSALDAIQTAQRRGVENAIISDATQMSAIELVNSGKLQEAQELLDIINAIPDAVARVHTITGETIDLPLAVDPDATQEQIDAAVNTAINNYQAGGGNIRAFEWTEVLFPTGGLDMSNAQGVMDTVVNDLRGQFDTAMDSQNWVEAFNIAQKLNDEGGVAMAQDQARQTGENIITALADGVNLLNPFAKDDTPIGFISDQMQEMEDGTIPDWRAELNRTPEALRNMGMTASEASGGVAELDARTADADLTLSIFGVTVDTTMATARDNMAAYVPEIITYLEKIRDASTEAGNALGKVSVPGGRGVGGVGSQESVSEKASGGTFKGASLVGEQGVEMVFADETMAVWNNNTTRAFLAGTQVAQDMFFDGSMGGGGGGYSDNRTFNVNATNHNYGAAQRGSSDARIARAVKGF